MFWFVAAAAVLIAGPARSAPSSCYSVRTPDIRQFCLARETGDPARCDAIRAPDHRTLCRDRVTTQRLRAQQRNQ